MKTIFFLSFKLSINLVWSPKSSQTILAQSLQKQRWDYWQVKGTEHVQYLYYYIYLNLGVVSRPLNAWIYIWSIPHPNLKNSTKVTLLELMQGYYHDHYCG